MKIRALLTQRVEAAFAQLGLSGPAVLQSSSRPELGDYQANGVMGAAKRGKRNPREVAQEVVDCIDLEGIASEVSVAGPGFINIRLSEQFLAQATAKPIPASSPYTVVVDYSGPNLAKEMHVGHLRSTIIGDSIARVCEALGHTVIRQNHVGDWGTQFGMLLTYMNESGASSDSLKDLEDFYREAKQRFDSDPEFQTRSRKVVVELQSGDAATLAQWQTFIDISMSHCQSIYQQLGVGLQREHMHGESAYNDDLAPIVAHLDAHNLLQESAGAQCVFLEEFKNRDGEPLPIIVKKSDGGFLYATSDLAAVRYRVQQLKADRVLYFVDARQALHFKQIFAVAKAAGLVEEQVELNHMPFGTMLGKNNKPFKTREGALVKLSDLLDEAVLRAKQMLLDRKVQEKNPQIDAAELDHIAKVIGIGAIKYADLSKNRTSDYVFDWDQMLSFEGNTSPYLQYAYTRIQSIFSRADIDPAELPERVICEDEWERRLAVSIAGFNDLLDQVAEEGYPHQLCAYLYDLAGRFAQFYEQCPILSSEHEVKVRRLKLAAQAADVLATGLELLGIGVVQRM